MKEIVILPLLTCLVVNETTNLPGDGFQRDDLLVERERVSNDELTPTPISHSMELSTGGTIARRSNGDNYAGNP